MHRTILGKDIYVPLDPYKTSRRIEIRMLKKYLDVQADDVLLDIGSGTGYWTENLSGPAWTVGLDLMWLDTSIAAEHHTGPHAVFVQGNAERLPFPDATFTKIFGVCSVEHIPDNESAFSEFSRCLRPGGVIALTLDSLNYHAITEKQRAEHAERFYVPHFYTRESVTDILTRNGFDVTHTDYLLCSAWSHWLNQWVDKNRKLQYLFFPFTYPITVYTDRHFGRKDQGWKLGVRAVKR